VYSDVQSCIVRALDSKSCVSFFEWQCIEESIVCGSVVHREGVYVIFSVCRRLDMCVSCCSVLWCVVAVCCSVLLQCILTCNRAFFEHGIFILTLFWQCHCAGS